MLMIDEFGIVCDTCDQVLELYETEQTVIDTVTKINGAEMVELLTEEVFSVSFKMIDKQCDKVGVERVTVALEKYKKANDERTNKIMRGLQQILADVHSKDDWDLTHQKNWDNMAEGLEAAISFIEVQFRLTKN